MDACSSDDTHTGMAESTEAIRAGTERSRRNLGGTVQALAAKTDLPGRAQRQWAELSGRLPELAGKVAARAASLSRKYPARLAALTGAALAGIIAGRRRRSR
jgi:Protein of unknown function (DUF3618)